MDLYQWNHSCHLANDSTHIHYRFSTCFSLDYNVKWKLPHFRMLKYKLSRKLFKSEVEMTNLGEYNFTLV